MKKILIIALSGILIGSLFAYYIFSSIEEEVVMAMGNNNEITTFQIGVFSIYENALKLQNKYPDSYIYQDNNVYRVITAIYQDHEIINMLEKYYQKNNIEYYLKKTNASNVFMAKLKKYETILKESSDINTILMTNKKLLEDYKNEQSN